MPGNTVPVAPGWCTPCVARRGRRHEHHALRLERHRLADVEVLRVASRARRGRERPARAASSAAWIDSPGCDRRQSLAPLGVASDASIPAVASDAREHAIVVTSWIPPLPRTLSGCPVSSHVVTLRTVRARDARAGQDAAAIQSAARARRGARCGRRRSATRRRSTSVSVFVHVAVTACTSPAGRNSSCSASSTQLAARVGARRRRRRRASAAGARSRTSPRGPRRGSRARGRRRTTSRRGRWARPGRAPAGARERGPDVVALADAVVEGAGAGADAAEVEPQAGRRHAAGSAWNSSEVTSERIDPPYCGCGWQSTTCACGRVGGRQLGVEGLAVVGDQRHALRPWEASLRSATHVLPLRRRDRGPAARRRSLRRDDGRVVVGAPRPERRLPRRGDPPCAQRRRRRSGPVTPVADGALREPGRARATSRSPRAWTGSAGR